MSDAPSPPPFGVLVITVWVDEAAGFRARLSRIRELDAPEQRVEHSADRDSVVEFVRVWLAEMRMRKRRDAG